MEVKERKRAAKVKLVTVIRHPDQEKEMFELWVEGFVIEKQGFTYLSYEEVQEGGNVRTTVKMGDEEALILRGGAIKMRLPLQINEQRLGSYDSGVGSLAMTVHTHTLQYEKQENGGRFHVVYDLLTDGKLVGSYQLDFTYTEGKS